MAKYKLHTHPDVSPVALEVEADDVKWEDGFVKFVAAGGELVRALPQVYVLSVAVV